MLVYEPTQSTSVFANSSSAMDVIHKFNKYRHIAEMLCIGLDWFWRADLYMSGGYETQKNKLEYIKIML